MTATLVPTIGLEVHVQLATASKLFSPAPSASLGDPNTRVHLVDLGLPGALPVANAHAVALAARAALALGGAVQPTSRFARKHYFYPDLPKGYQISQYERPYCVGGTVPLGDGRTCALERIHLEEDAGKLMHTDAGTLIDLNRAGTPLIEIVSRPELHAAGDAHAFLVHLREILRFCGVSDCDMELGSLRCDANVSLAPAGAPLGTKVEIKNLNSFKMVQRAIEYEERRQTALLAAGGRVVQETRLWNDEHGETRSMRQKEVADDYRYLPDPDLPPLRIDDALVDQQRRLVGELPADRRARYRRDLGLPDYDVEQLTHDKQVGDWFERVLAAGAEPKAASNWVMTDVQQAARARGVPVHALPLAPETLADLLRLLDGGALTVPGARQVFAHLLEHGGAPQDAVDRLGLRRIDDPTQLGPLADAAIAALPQAAAAVRQGTAKALDALKGHVMRATRGKADPQMLEQVLRQRLDP
ncbi:MAG: Asp-tRNA(Asn)/Glu-tRNA(Gln) amidotransferase subunit GatB [Planctomycetota bacterium]